MRRFEKLIQRFMNNEPKKILGRWDIDHCNKKTNKKIDYANEDHCGPCGQYNIVELPIKKKPVPVE